MSQRAGRHEQLCEQLKELRLTTMARSHQEVAIRAEKEGWSYGGYLSELAGYELTERAQRRLERHLRESHLPPDKTLQTLELERFPVKVKRQLATLCEGSFVQQATNVLAFGPPGVGKTHALCAIGHALVRNGQRVLFLAAYQLVQRLLAARRELKLEKELSRLEAYDAVLVDDLGYVQQGREEMEVLFTFLAERYERKSVLLTSNLLFSQWDRIFQDAMTTAAAIDRLVHHSVIIELPGPSYRTEAARKNQERSPDGP